MTEAELRMIVRDAIARHAGSGPAPQSSPLASVDARLPRQHSSHAMFALPVGADGACVIEPAVMCNHCGYCKSYGH